MKTFARVLFAAAVAAACTFAALSLGGGIDTDLYSLVGGDGVLSVLNAKSAGTVRVLCADADREAKCREAFRFDEPLDPTAFLETVRTHGRGLLSAKSRELLEKDDLDRIRRSVMRRDYTGVGLFPKEDDPNYFLSDFVSALNSLQPDAMEDGATVLTGTADGDRADADGLSRLIALAESDDGIWLSGSPFHTLIATERTKSEINILGTVSIIAVFAIGWILFGGFRFAMPTAIALACGFIAGTASVCLLPGRPHALTFLFGTTLVGLGVDYCYHAIGERHGVDFARNLFRALLTTCLAFVPLIFSHVAVLRQMSVFTIAGLVAIYGYVMLFCGIPPKITSAMGSVPNFSGSVPNSAAWFCPERPLYRCLKVLLYAVFAVLAVAAAVRGVRFSSDPTLFHKPTAVMARGEAKFAEISGDGAGGIFLVPLARWQERNAALKAKIEEPKGEFLKASDLPSWLTVTLDGEDFMLLPESAGASVIGDQSSDMVRKVSLRDELSSLFESMSAETYRLLAISFAVLLVVMTVVFRRRFAAHAWPVAAAAIATFASLAAFGEPITFFHALCFFILVGLGIDYAIFHNSASLPSCCGGLSPSEGLSPSVVPSGRIVFYSFLTSFVGFGMLVFTSFPVTRSMGVTLALGLFFSYFFSYFFSFFAASKGSVPNFSGSVPNSEDERVESSSDWASQKEQSAGRIRLFLIWSIYRFLGKTAAKILFFPAYLFIYPFCRPARAALRQYYGVLGIKGDTFRQILEFAWSMIDKTDACSLCKDPPSFTIEGDDGWVDGGCFLLSTHLGCIEVLPALRKTWGQTPSGRGGTLDGRAESVKVHAFQQMGHDALFTEMFAKKMDPSQLTLHAVEDIGVETAVEMKEAIARGEIVLMAGDRLPASAGRVRAEGPGGRGQTPRRREIGLERDIFGRRCRWPKGVFRFAAMMECPVYAIVCVKTGWNAYSVIARRLDGSDLLGGYVAFLEEETRKRPLQWYQFYPFFGPL
ncbi:MAG: MMPL family transporter [Kiritimatiellae bacterium]|nr:MMPL family transporter [Kiritimatiellia bacterium]